MSTEQIKAEFEDWWEREYKHLESSKFTDQVPHIKYGFYAAWEASRAALYVELPENFEVEMGAYGTAEVFSVDEVKAALRAAGITVKWE